MTTRYAVQVRKYVEVCTDPMRRFYNGAWASSEMRLTEWETLLIYSNQEDAVDTAATFARANRDREYRVQLEESNHETSN